nr:putative integron gene cassette protein [uncultured bacterium]
MLDKAPVPNRDLSNQTLKIGHHCLGLLLISRNNETRAKFHTVLFPNQFEHPWPQQPPPSMRFPNFHLNNFRKGNLNGLFRQIATEIEGSIVEPVFAVSSCKELILSVPLPPLLFDLCAQIVSLTTI